MSPLQNVSFYPKPIKMMLLIEQVIPYRNVLVYIKLDGAGHFVTLQPIVHFLCVKFTRNILEFAKTIERKILTILFELGQSK